MTTENFEIYFPENLSICLLAKAPAAEVVMVNLHLGSEIRLSYARLTVYEYDNV